MWTTTARISWLALLLGTAGCSGQTGPDLVLPPGSTRVLFIGNSLTYTNDLPGMLSKLSELAGQGPLGVASASFPDFALEDHWHDGTAAKLLTNHAWDFVVMQQGPSSLIESQANLRQWALRFAPPIRAAGAQPVLYMVWPASHRRGDFPGVRDSYRGAAAAVTGIFAPAGEAWLAAWEETPTRPLYGPDGFHPSVAGSYLAALVLLARIAGVDPLTLPATIPGTQLGSDVVRSLQQAARTALDRNPARPVP